VLLCGLYSGNVEGWRNVLDVNGGWGHIVSLSMEVDNLVPVHGVPLAFRWAALQADPVIHVDGSASATVLGSGLEDYFSYAHGFAGAENTTYAFVGVSHTAKQAPRSMDPLTWHCYRQHVLDPIPFRSSFRFFWEGTASNFSSPADPLDYVEHRRQKHSGLATLAHVILYYFRPTVASLPVCDRIWLGNVTSELRHRFQLVGRGSSSSGRTFALSDHPRRFIGDTSQNRTFLFAGGRAFGAGDVFRFELSIPSSAAAYRLRRTSYSVPLLWNDRSNWSLNGIDQGIWFVPKGSLSDEYSLVEDDRIVLRRRHLMSGQFDSKVVVAQFEFRPVSDTWNDISYELCVSSD